MNNLADASQMLEHGKGNKDLNNMTSFYTTYNSVDKTQESKSGGFNKAHGNT